MLIALSILWGGSFFFVGVAVDDLPPLTIVTLRVGVAAIVLWGIAFVSGFSPPRKPGVWGALFGMGLLNNVIPFVLIVWGQTQIASGLASVLNAATPLFTVAVAGLLLPDERATPLKLVGVAVGFAGVAVMIGLPATGEENSFIAQVAVLAAALCYAFAGVYGRRFKVLALDPIVTAAGQITASTLILAPITLYVDGPLDILAPGSSTWSAIAGLAILSTAVAYILYFKILESAGATNLLLVTLLIPVSAVFLGSMFLSETLELIQFAGMILIALGLSAIDGRLWKRRVPIAGTERVTSDKRRRAVQLK